MIIPKGKSIQHGNRKYVPGDNAPDSIIPESWKEKKPSTGIKKSQQSPHSQADGEK